MIPLLANIEMKLRSPDLVSYHDELVVERACYLARIGYFDEVEQTLKHLRSSPTFGSSARVAVLAMICDGLVLLFRDQSGGARDRFLRAKVVAKSTQAEDLYRMASAWIAHIDFGAAAYEDMATALQVCVGHNEAQGESAALRAYIVAANAATYIGAFDKAKQWYRIAHTKAVRSGDQVSIEAIIYNRTVFRLGRARVMRCLGVEDASAAFISMEVSSAAAYYAAVGYKSLNHLILAIQARVSMFLGHFADAIPRFEALVDSGKKVSFEPDQLMLELELAACRAKLGVSNEDPSDWRGISLDAISKLDPDDRLLCIDVLRSLLEAGVRIDFLGADLRSEFESAVLGYEEEVRRVSRALSTVSFDN